MFSVMKTVTFALLEPEVEDKVIQGTSLVAVQLAFDEIEILFEAASEVTEMLVGDTEGTSTLAPFCVTVIVLLREPEVRFVSETVTVPVRFEIPVLDVAFTVIVLPLVVTVSQSASFVALKDPSVTTVAVFDPPSALNDIEVGSTVK